MADTMELAKELGVSKQYISNRENDSIQPSVDMLVRSARFFSVSRDYLLGPDKHTVVDVSGLTDSETAHIKLIIKDMQKNNDIPTLQIKSCPSTSGQLFCQCSGQAVCSAQRFNELAIIWYASKVLL
ncbi:MAG: helix-turn-helix transcriptional regulator [Clostridia bacterium]|nr:helix-turn-helix transcriptional regulator [Clostridia bacterium]